METTPTKLRNDLTHPESVARRTDDGDETRDAKFGLLKITRPLDINPEEQGGDPYNSTGRFSRIKD